MRARLSEPASIDSVKSALRFGAVAVTFCAQSTRFEMYLIPMTAIADAEEESHTDSSFILVAIANFHAAHYFMPGSLSSGYVMEKLRLQCDGDANNLTAFLNALGHIEPAATYLQRLKFAENSQGERLDYVEDPVPRSL